MNQPCTVLISSDGKLSAVDLATLRADLESKDIQKKRNAVKSAIIQMSNGKDMSDLLMTVIRFCVTVDDHELTKLLHMYCNYYLHSFYSYWECAQKCDENGELLDDEIRLTKFGKFLRNSSLDELPEAFNILMGDMSVVGPRPLRVKYIPRYNAIQRRRHEVRPGFTGLAQVSGRNAISWEEKFDYDVKYVDNSDFSKLNRSKLYENDILYTYVGTVGQVGLVDKNDKYYLAPNVARIRILDKKVNPKYVMHFLLTNEFKTNQLDPLSGTSSMKNITMTNIRKFKIKIIVIYE